MDERGRTILSVSIVVAGVVLACIAGMFVSDAETEQAQGVVIDFGERNTVWTDAELSQFSSEIDLLRYACDQNGLQLTIAEDGTVSDIDGTPNEGDSRWDLWVIYPGSSEWVKLSSPYDQDPSEFTVSSWSYVVEGGEPTVAVDYSGNPIYGYQQKLRVVSLSPSITEILASVKADKILVGVDSYSDYPQSVVDATASGSVSIIGTYSSPSFELIVGTNPDVVFADSSQKSHSNMVGQLRASGIDSVLLYPGEDLESIMDNIFIVGKVIGYDLAAEEVIADTYEVVNKLAGIAYGPQSGNSVDVMISLEPDISPWVSGSSTYLSSLAQMFNSTNVFSQWDGWVHITSDRIPYSNPEKIIIVTSEYSATAEEYEHLFNNLPAQWKDTDAWRNGEVYVLCDGAADLVQRFGPRTAQVAEIVAMILHPEGFGGELPKIIGDDYRQYLDYSSYMSFD